MSSEQKTERRERLCDSCRYAQSKGEPFGGVFCVTKGCVEYSERSPERHDEEENIKQEIFERVRDRKRRPPPEAARVCPDCKHEIHLGVVSGQCLAAMPISGDFCGHRCPAPEGEAVAETKLYPPEGCSLVAHDTGEGWALTVEDASHETIAYLAWPESFGELQTPAQLQAKGFIIV